MKRIMIITSLMFSSIIVSNACVGNFNVDYNVAEAQYASVLEFCDNNFIYVESADNFCRQTAHMAFVSEVDDAIEEFSNCLDNY